ncbi:YggS family pyridoxal phosphate-dependent enzyme [Vibrio sp.]|nr:YggS family pyridoxal phosphate-dependent enzyme [Vibrio sp.]
MNSIKQNLEAITQQIDSSIEKCGRSPKSVQLLAVSKTKPVSAIEEAIKAGQRAFGENYVQEGVDKVSVFKEHSLSKELEWHFIGPIQSNKTRPVAESFDWIHTIDRDKIAKRLNDQRPETMDNLQVLIQVNTSGETSKSGVEPKNVFALAAFIATQEKLTLRGLMSIPANVSSYEQQLNAFQHLHQLHSQLKEHYNTVDTLSMGMSGDMEAAIESGSTMVRIGTAIFGTRDYQK